MNGAPTRVISLHATVVAIGEAGVLVRGASGAGKSRLAQALIEAARARGIFGRLVADDRVQLTSNAGRLLARPFQAIAGLIEERGTGLLRIPHESAVVVRCMVDFDPAGEGESYPRLPSRADAWGTIEEVEIPRMRLDPRVSPTEGALRVLGRLDRPEAP